MSKKKRDYTPPSIYMERLTEPLGIQTVDADTGVRIGRPGNILRTVQTNYTDSAEEVIAEHAELVRASVMSSDMAKCPRECNHTVHKHDGVVTFAHIAGDLVSHEKTYTLAEFESLGWAEVAAQLTEWRRALHG